MTGSTVRQRAAAALEAIAGARAGNASRLAAASRGRIAFAEGAPTRRYPAQQAVNGFAGSAPARCRTHSARAGPRARRSIAGDRRRHRTARAQRAGGARRVARRRRGGGAHAFAGREGSGRAEEPRAPEPARDARCSRLLGDGLSNRDIADRLFISPKTAEHHVSRIYGKLGLKPAGRSGRVRRPQSRGPNRGFPPTAARPHRASSVQSNEGRTVMSEQNKELVREYYDAVINGRTSTRSTSSSRTSGSSKASGAGASATSRRSPTCTCPRRAHRRRRPRLPPLDVDRDARRRVQGDPADRPARRRGVRRSLPDRRRQVRRLLVPDERRRADATAHREVVQPAAGLDPAQERRSDAQGIEGDCLRDVRARGVRGTLRALRAVLGRVRDVHGRRRPGSALRGPSRRPLPVPALGLRREGKVKFTFADGHEETYEAATRTTRRPGTCPTLTQARRSSSSAPRPSSRRRWRSSRGTWRRSAADHARGRARARPLAIRVTARRGTRGASRRRPG